MCTLRFISVLALLALLLSASLSAATAQSQSGLIIEVQVEGLTSEDVAVLQLLPDRSDTAAELSARGITLPRLTSHNGSYRINVPNIPDGTYKLVVDAPAPYFRQPLGYLFQTSASQIVRSPNLPLSFKMIPASVQGLPPCRDFAIQPDSSPSSPGAEDILPEQKIVCMAEPLVDLSGPPKQPEPQEQGGMGTLGAGYHYAGPKTTQDNNGVWGRNYVVNPGVDHSAGVTEFIAERVYADNGSRWMETGWAEVSWRDNKQYVYEMDSVTGQWTFFDQYALSTGSAVETEVYYNSSISKWRALYYLGSSQWAVLAEKSLGFTTADNGYNRGEAYTSDSTHPTLPESTFNKGYLLISGVWNIWDTRYSTTVAADSPYTCQMVNQYYNFKIKSQ